MADISADTKEQQHDDEKVEYGVKPATVESDDSSGEELHTVEKGYSADDVVIDLPKREQQRILRKVDYRLVPILSLLYLVAFVDRSNIGMS